MYIAYPKSRVQSWIIRSAFPSTCQTREEDSLVLDVLLKHFTMRLIVLLLAMISSQQVRFVLIAH